MKKEARPERVYDSTTPFKVVKQERNSPCKCGSGKKAKSCCGTDFEYFTKNKES